MTRSKGRMDIRLYKKLIDEIAIENPYVRIWLDYYGEPLLQQFKLFYMIDYAKKKGLSNISFNTNGTLLNQEMILGLTLSALIVMDFQKKFMKRFGSTQIVMLHTQILNIF